MKIMKLTDRSFEDLREIEQYSIRSFGKKVANKYMDDIESGLVLLSENAGLLQDVEGFSGRLKYYRIRHHFLICSEFKEFLLVLTIKHVQMDIIKRLAKLETTLILESELLLDRLK